MSVSSQLVLQADVDAFVLDLGPRLERFVTLLTAAAREIAEIKALPPGLDSQGLTTAEHYRSGLQVKMGIEIAGAIRVAWDRVQARLGKAANREQFEAEMMAAPAVQGMLRGLVG